MTNHKVLDEMYFVYVLRSKKDGNLYTGSTNNLKDRVKRHNAGLEKSTKDRRPFKLIYYEACLNNKDARRRGAYLKTSWGKAYIKKRLKNYYKDEDD